MKIEMPFRAADILIPRGDHTLFSTVACDQFTAEPKYWEQVRELTDGHPTAYRITLPEVYLSDDNSERINAINTEMKHYLDSGLFAEYPHAMIYVERTLSNGNLRRGLVGAIDLEAYDYTPGTTAPIRATEGTVPERIPPRVLIRRDAPLEMPHIMLLIDDPKRTVIEPLKDSCTETVYDFDLMTGAGHLRGALVPESIQESILSALAALCGDEEHPFLFAVGDGNHSLATAKQCYLDNPTPENRYALVEVVNVHDDALVFEPIYRVVFGADTDELIGAVRAHFAAMQPECLTSTMAAITSKGEQSFPCTSFPVGELQELLAAYVAEHPGTVLDYIHGESSLRELSEGDGAVGFLFEGMKKSELFPYIREKGILPRKAFSMGEALDKRFYMECRAIRLAEAKKAQTEKAKTDF